MLADLNEMKLAIVELVFVLEYRSYNVLLGAMFCFYSGE